MKNRFIRYTIVLIGLLSTSLFAQMEERALTRKGNEFIKDSLFVFAEAEYLKSLDILDFDTNRFNLAFAMLGQEKFDEAISEWEAVEDITDNKILKSISAYNVATVYAVQQKMDEAIEGYKQSLRYFPKNDAARHNYWFLKLLKDQNPQPEQDQDQKNDDQNKDDQNEDDQDKKDQNKDQNKDGENGDQKKDQQNSDEESDKDEKSEEDKKSEDDEKSEDEKDSEEDKKSGEDEKSEEEKEKEKESESDDQGKEDSEKDQDSQQGNEPQPKEGELSKADALRLLESLDKEEDKTQEKIKAKLLKGKNNKKHEKDW